MRDVLLSVKPKHVKLILDGSKKWDVRKKIWRASVTDPVRYVYIYASAPVQEVVARFTPGEIKTWWCPDSPCYEIMEHHHYDWWKTVKSDVALSADEFLDYFGCAHGGYAIEIRDLQVYHVPVNRNFIRCAPQNYRYLTEWESRWLDIFMNISGPLEVSL